MSSKEITFLILSILTVISICIIIYNSYEKKIEELSFLGWTLFISTLLIGWFIIGITAPLGDVCHNIQDNTIITKSETTIYIEIIKPSGDNLKEKNYITFDNKKDFDNISDSTVIYELVEQNIYGYSLHLSYYYIDKFKVRNYSK